MDIIDELRDEIKQEKVENFFKTYQNYVYGVIVFILACTAGYSFWQKNQTDKMAEMSNLYMNALQLAGAGQKNTALRVLEDIPLKGNNAYTDLSRLLSASMLFDQGKPKEALRVYDVLQSEGSSDPLLVELAEIRALYATIDTDRLEDLKKKVSPFLTEKSPWYPSALEIRGLIAMREANHKEAIENFSLLAELKTAPQSMSQRADLLRNLIKGMESDEK